MLEPWFQIIPGKVVDNVIAPIDLPADKYPAIMTLEKFLKNYLVVVKEVLN